VQCFNVTDQQMSTKLPCPKNLEHSDLITAVSWMTVHDLLTTRNPQVKPSRRRKPKQLTANHCATNADAQRKTKQLAANQNLCAAQPMQMRRGKQSSSLPTKTSALQTT
jgi:hypothetical protein